jgi:microcin C transport system substrate-binding protein
MNNMTSCLAYKWLLLLLFTLITACGETEKPQEQVTTTPQHHVLKTYSISEFTEELVWETNNDDPIFADPTAQKGGMFRTYTTTFPLTLRTVGPDSNNQMRSFQDGNKLSLVGQHPETGNIIPEMATHWAYGADNKTVYYKLHPDARWSDGYPVTADDFIFTLEFMRSPHIVAPWYNNHYSNEILEVKKYDDHTISITGVSVKPKVDLHYYYGINPTPQHFHVLDDSWVKNYNWKVEPNTGPYHLNKVKKGKFLEFELKQDWWAKDLRYFQHRYNIKRVRIKVIRDEEIAYKHFIKGELDAFNLSQPKHWHDRAKGEFYDRGLIQKVWFYNDIPRSPIGLYLNQDVKLFSDQNTRFGFAHAINMEGMIKNVMRGDYNRLPSFHVGYGKFSNPDVSARSFDIEQAGRYLDEAGWDTFDSDGIRIKGNRRLSASITYGSALHNDKLVFIKEEAKKSGVEIILEQLDGASFYKKLNEKTYQIAFLNFSTGYRPAFWQHLHSKNAHKPQTNNLTNTDNSVIDKKIMLYRTASEEQQRQQLSRELNQMIHDQGAFIPGYYAPYTRSAYWRWLKLPSFIGTRKSSSVVSIFGSTGGLIWIDQQEKEQTMDAKKSDKSYPPVTLIDTRYKTK